MQSTEKVCEHQNANYLAMMRERDDARAALAAERDRADRAEALAENWRNDSREETEEHLVWKARADLAETRLNQILVYAESTYTASTVARRIVQMGKAPA